MNLMIEIIAHRKGFWNVLADGWNRTIEAIGEEFRHVEIFAELYASATGIEKTPEDRERGWDEATGIPTVETLRRLGLDREADCLTDPTSMIHHQENKKTSLVQERRYDRIHR